MIRVQEKNEANESGGEVLTPFDYSALSKDQAKLAREAADFIEARQRGMAGAVLEIGRKLR